MKKKLTNDSLSYIVTKNKMQKSGDLEVLCDFENEDSFISLELDNKTNQSDKSTYHSKDKDNEKNQNISLFKYKSNNLLNDECSIKNNADNFLEVNNSEKIKYTRLDISEDFDKSRLVTRIKKWLKCCFCCKT